MYKYPGMNRNEFKESYLNNLLNYDQDTSTIEFFDSLSSNLFLTLILQPIRVTINSETLIDNTFSNAISPNIISSNIISSILDHLNQTSQNSLSA